jgi:hypothetical protein
MVVETSVPLFWRFQYDLIAVSKNETTVYIENTCMLSKKRIGIVDLVLHHKSYFFKNIMWHATSCVLKAISDTFMKEYDMKIWYGTDFELTAEWFPGDHAGEYEISVLMSIRPDLIDFGLMPEDGTGETKLALHASAGRSDPDYGKRIMQAAVESLVKKVHILTPHGNNEPLRKPLSFSEIDAFWNCIVDAKEQWACLQPRAGQQTVSESSRWRANEYCEIPSVDPCGKKF